MFDVFHFLQVGHTKMDDGDDTERTLVVMMMMMAMACSDDDDGHGTYSNNDIAIDPEDSNENVYSPTNDVWVTQ